jgi:hypothetical protein
VGQRKKGRRKERASAKRKNKSSTVSTELSSNRKCIKIGKFMLLFVIVIIVIIASGLLYCRTTIAKPDMERLTTGGGEAHPQPSTNFVEIRYEHFDASFRNFRSP